jgi:hypothetical protein
MCCKRDSLACMTEGYREQGIATCTIEITSHCSVGQAQGMLLPPRKL